MSDHTAELPDLQPEPQPQPPRRSNRGVIAVVASVVAVVIIAGGGYAAWQFFAGGGPRPAEVLPDTTFALVTVDLNPSGGQKVAAIKTLRKFPSWNKRTGITPDSDVVEAIFDEAFKNGPCKALDYEKDVKPWIGQRAGFGGVVLDKKPRPVVALQIKDAAKARTGFAELADCSGAGDGDDFGWTISDDYLMVSDSVAHAKAIAAAGKKSSLAENADFQKWTDEVGGPGIVNAYAGPKSIKILSDGLGPDLGGLDGMDGMEGLPGLAGGVSLDGSGGVAAVPGADTEDQLADVFKDFKGAAAGLKFADGGIELAFAGGGAANDKSPTVGKQVGDLPEDTAAALALAIPDKALDKLRSSGQEGDLLSLGKMFTAGTGLELPDDLITLLGSSLSLSLGGDAPADLDDAGPSDLPIGLLVHGDDAKIKAVIAKVEANTGARLADLPATLASEDGKVAVSTQPGYAEDLLDNGSLGEAKNFKDVVTHAGDAQAVAYVSFDGAWGDVIRKLAADGNDKDASEVAENVKVLRALGISAWSEGSTGHGLVRLVLK